jgi:hypothetical protein
MLEGTVEKEYDVEEETNNYINKIKDYQEYFITKSIEELEKEKLDLKPKNICDYFSAFFSKSDERLTQLHALEIVLKDKKLNVYKEKNN